MRELVGGVLFRTRDRFWSSPGGWPLGPSISLPRDPRVTGIVVNYHLHRATEGAVPSLLKSGCAECIVVNNGGEVPTLTLTDARVQVLRPTDNLGFGQAVNLAASRASGDVLLFLNPDAVLLPGAMDVLLHALDRGASIGGSVELGIDGLVHTYAADVLTLLGELLAAWAGRRTVAALARRLSAATCTAGRALAAAAWPFGLAHSLNSVASPAVTSCTTKTRTCAQEPSRREVPLLSSMSQYTDMRIAVVQPTRPYDSPIRDCIPPVPVRRCRSGDHRCDARKCVYLGSCSDGWHRRAPTSCRPIYRQGEMVAVLGSQSTHSAAPRAAPIFHY